MELIMGNKIEVMTGYKQVSAQIRWLIQNRIQHYVNAQGQVWTTPELLIGGRSSSENDENDGFDLGCINAQN
tara:strand:+ start:5012 stop:5227 length:216 start_codon:yes stop_codon:yes gene_type:complete